MCDHEVHRITETLTPAGQKSLQGLVQQQQRQSKGEMPQLGDDSALLAPLVLLVPTDVLETSSETSNETVSSLALPSVPHVEVVDLSDIQSVSADKLRLIRDMIFREENRRAMGGHVASVAPKKPPTLSPAFYNGSSSSSGGNSAKARSPAAAQSAATARPRSAQPHSWHPTSSSQNKSLATGGTARRNSKDKALLVSDHALRRSFTAAEDELLFAFDADEGVGPGMGGHLDGGSGTSSTAGSHEDRFLRQGAVPPNLKMFESGRDFRDPNLGTSPSRLPSFGLEGKGRANTVKPKDVKGGYKKYYGDDHDKVPVLGTLSEQLAFVNAQGSSTLTVSPLTAFDDRSQGSQSTSTASSSSGRGVLLRGAGAGGVSLGAGCDELRQPTSALSRSLRANSSNSIGAPASATAATDAVATASAVCAASAPVAAPSPDVAAADATTEAHTPAADSAAAAAADAQGGACFGLAPPQDGGSSPQSASFIASALAWAIVDEAVAPLPDA